MSCPHTQDCEMYQLFTLAGALAVWKTNYCSGDFARCVRYQRSQVGEPVPLNLLPNGTMLRRAGEGDDR